LEKGKTICCQGKIEKYADEIAKVNVDEVCSMEEALSRYATALQIHLELAQPNNEKLDVIKNYQQQSNAFANTNARINFIVLDSKTNYEQKYSSTSTNLSYTIETINFLAELFGKENISLAVKIPTPPPSKKRN
jgi:hypothetical protein